MALGDAAETILIRNMVADGWEVADTRAVPGGEQIELEIAWPLPMTGHPDGICRHPEHTNGQWVTLECKSMSTGQLQRVRQAGIAQVYPEYLAQVACYSRILFEQGRVAHPRRAVFACMDRDGDNPAPERVKWTGAQEEKLWNKLAGTWRLIESDTAPSRPYEPDDVHCRYCPYHTRCQGQDPPAGWERPAITYDDELVAAAESWLQADRARRKARDTLSTEVADPYGPGLIAGPLQASWFWPKERDTYDPEILERMVPADVLRQCRNSQAKGPAFWIRPRRR